MDAFLNALKAVSNTFSQHIVKLFYRANRAFISQSLLPAQGPWVDPGKKEDFGNLSSSRRGFQLVFEKGLTETWSCVITRTTFLSSPYTRTLSCSPSPKISHQKGARGKYVGDSVIFWHSLCNGVDEMLKDWGPRAMHTCGQIFVLLQPGAPQLEIHAPA